MMSENLTLRRPEDPSRINISRRSELVFWANKFDVSEEIIIDAVQNVGFWIVDVKIYLGKWSIY